MVKVSLHSRSTDFDVHSADKRLISRVLSVVSRSRRLGAGSSTNLLSGLRNARTLCSAFPFGSLAVAASSLHDFNRHLWADRWLRWFFGVGCRRNGFFSWRNGFFSWRNLAHFRWRWRFSICTRGCSVRCWCSQLSYLLQGGLLQSDLLQSCVHVIGCLRAVCVEAFSDDGRESGARVEQRETSLTQLGLPQRRVVIRELDGEERRVTTAGCERGTRSDSLRKGFEKNLVTRQHFVLIWQKSCWNLKKMYSENVFW